MDFRTLKKLTIGGVELKQLFINGVQVWKSGYKNWVPYSTTEDGKTIYNGTGYKEGYRVRSGGAEATTTTSTVTGFMPIKGSSVVRVGGTNTTFKNGGTAQAINVYNSSFTVLGQIVGNATSGGYGMFDEPAWVAYGSQTVVQEDTYWQWAAPPDTSGIAYIRVTGRTMDGTKLIVTIDEEIPQ